MKDWGKDEKQRELEILGESKPRPFLLKPFNWCYAPHSAPRERLHHNKTRPRPRPVQSARTESYTQATTHSSSSAAAALERTGHTGLFLHSFRRKGQVFELQFIQLKTTITTSSVSTRLLTEWKRRQIILTFWQNKGSFFSIHLKELQFISLLFSQKDSEWKRRHILLILQERSVWFTWKHYTFFNCFVSSPR